MHCLYVLIHMGSQSTRVFLSFSRSPCTQTVHIPSHKWLFILTTDTPRKRQPNCSGPTSPPSGQGGELSSPLTSSSKWKTTCLTTFFIPVCVPSYPRKRKYASNLFSFHTLPIFSLSDIIPSKVLKHQIRIKIFLSMHHDKKEKSYI